MKKLINWLFFRNKKSWSIIVEGKFVYSGEYDFKKAKRLAHEIENSVVELIKQNNMEWFLDGLQLLFIVFIYGKIQDVQGDVSKLRKIIKDKYED